MAMCSMISSERRMMGFCFRRATKISFSFLLLISLFLALTPVAKVHALSVTTRPQGPPDHSSLSPTSSSRVVQAITADTTQKKLQFSKEPRRPRRQHRPETQAWLDKIDEVLNETQLGSLSKKTLSQLYPVITCWARKKSSEGAFQAQHYFNRYVAEFEAGNPHAVLQVRLFNSCIDAWTKSRRRDAPQQIQQVLRTMEQFRKKAQPHPPVHVEQLKPDVITMSSFCLAWAKSRQPDAPRRASMILDYMELNNLTPNTRTYNAVLLAYVHSNRRDKALCVETIIDRMNERCASDDAAPRPDVCTYQCLIAAWSRTSMEGTAEKAHQVLQWMLEQPSPDLQPNAHCYVAAIHAWAHSEETGKASKAYGLMKLLQKKQQQDDENNRPNVVAYTAVLNACALPLHDEEAKPALKIARRVYWDEMSANSVRPNFLTHAAFLHVLATTTAATSTQQRDEWAVEAFQRAKAHGQVGYIVLEKLYTASPRIYQDVVRKITNRHDVVRIPFQWQRNVVGERDPQSRVLKDDMEAKLDHGHYRKLKEVKRKYGPPKQWHKLDEEHHGRQMGNDVELSWRFDSL